LWVGAKQPREVGRGRRQVRSAAARSAGASAHARSVVQARTSDIRVWIAARAETSSPGSLSSHRDPCDRTSGRRHPAVLELPASRASPPTMRPYRLCRARTSRMGLLGRIPSATILRAGERSRESARWARTQIVMRSFSGPEVAPNSSARLRPCSSPRARRRWWRRRTEGACKSVITMRFKRSGQRWFEEGLSPCLQLRALHLNARLRPCFDLLVTARAATLEAA
jgi:hypothetical protein